MKVSLRAVILYAMAALALVAVVTVNAQQIQSLTIGNFWTLDASSVATPVSVKAAPTSGTMATQEYVLSKMPVQGPSLQYVARSITLVNGTFTDTFPAFTSAPVCHADDPSGPGLKWSNTTSSITITGPSTDTVVYFCFPRN